MNNFDERGITLVELLASLALFGVISILIWNFFFQGFNSNERAITQNQLQQEANLIVITIQELHTKYTVDSVSIENPSNDKFGSKMSIIANSLPDPVEFNKPNIEYKINGPISVTGNSFKLELSLRSKNDPNIQFETKTTFSKLSANATTEGN